MERLLIPKSKCDPLKGVAVFFSILDLFQKRQRLMMLDEDLAVAEEVELDKKMQVILNLLAAIVIEIEQLCPDDEVLEKEIAKLAVRLRNKFLLNCLLNAEILMQRRGQSFLNSERLEIVIESVVIAMRQKCEVQ